MVDLANIVWRDYNTAGVPSSGNKKPDKAEIRTWGAYVESLGLVFDTVAAMAADTTLTAGQVVKTLGYYATGDGGGNVYKIVAAATGTDDGGSYIDLAGSSMQALGMFPAGTASPKQFGAAAARTGAQNNTSISAADTYAAAAGLRVLADYEDYTVATQVLTAAYVIRPDYEYYSPDGIITPALDADVKPCIERARSGYTVQLANNMNAGTAAITTAKAIVIEPTAASPTAYTFTGRFDFTGNPAAFLKRLSLQAQAGSTMHTVVGTRAKIALQDTTISVPSAMTTGIGVWIYDGSNLYIQPTIRNLIYDFTLDTSTNAIVRADYNSDIWAAATPGFYAWIKSGASRGAVCTFTSSSGYFHNIRVGGTSSTDGNTLVLLQRQSRFRYLQDANPGTSTGLQTGQNLLWCTGGSRAALEGTDTTGIGRLYLATATNGLQRSGGVAGDINYNTAQTLFSAVTNATVITAGYTAV